MLSGFVMWLNYGARLREQGLSGAPQYWWKRIARIWPLHALVLAGMALFAVMLALTGRDTANYPLAELPLQIRGFGPVKAANEARAAKRREELLAMFRAGGGDLARAAE